MQQTYMNAFAHLAQFKRRSKFSTWLIRIAVREALMRKRRRGRIRSADDNAASRPRNSLVAVARSGSCVDDGTRERAIDDLPAGYRLVYVLREIEGLNTAETAAALQIGGSGGENAFASSENEARNATQRTRRDGLEIVSFMAPRSDAVVKAVLSKIRLPHASRGRNLLM
jgi:RNA polymerase sigma-70 factor, ECF subfamily